MCDKSILYFLQVFMLTNYISIYLNGKPFNCMKNLLLSELLIYLDIVNESNIVEYNSTIVPEPSWNKIILKQGDKIELLTMVGGG